MGQSSGKLILNPIHRSKPESNESNSPETVKPVETASQLVNGDASAMSNVPAIDDVVELSSEKPVGESRTEDLQTVDDGPNGTVHPTQSGDKSAQERKSSNPINWIKRRLSKKSAAKPQEPEIEAIAEQKPEEPVDTTLSTLHESETPAIPEVQVTETANSLVDEVISAVTTESGRKDAPEAPAASGEEAQASSMEEPEASPDKHFAEESTTNSAEQLETTEVEEPSQEDPKAHEELEQSTPIFDTNNTNVNTELNLDEPDNTYPNEQVQDSVLSKLSELELTNGHPEEGVPKVNGIEGGEHGEGVMNGE